MGQGPETRPFIPPLPGVSPKFWKFTRQLDSLTDSFPSKMDRQGAAVALLAQARQRALENLQKRKGITKVHRNYEALHERNNLVLNLILAKGFAKEGPLLLADLDIIFFANPDNGFMHPLSNNRVAIDFNSPDGEQFRLETRLLDLSETLARSSLEPAPGSDEIVSRILVPARAYPDEETPGIFASSRLFEMKLSSNRMKELDGAVPADREKRDQFRQIEKRIARELLVYVLKNPGANTEVSLVNERDHPQLHFEHPGVTPMRYSVPFRWVEDLLDSEQLAKLRGLSSPTASSSAAAAAAGESPARGEA